MKHSIHLMARLPGAPTRGHAVPSLDGLQGAWWSSSKSPTADFAIRGEEVWPDSTGTYVSCHFDDGIPVLDSVKQWGRSTIESPAWKTMSWPWKGLEPGRGT